MRVSRKRSFVRKKLFLEMLEARRVFAALLDAPSPISPDGLWATVTDHNSLPVELKKEVRAQEYGLYTLDASALMSELATAPNQLGSNNTSQLVVPKPTGGFERFQIYSSSIMPPELATKYPSIRTFAGQGLDNPAATVWFDVTPQGFHAQVISPQGDYFVDPYSSATSSFYASYSMSQSIVDTGFRELGAISSGIGSGNSNNGEGETGGSGSRSSGTQLRTYRLAVAADGEYTQFHGGTKTAGLAAVVTAVNRVRGIYETELSISFTLVANEDQLIYTDPNTDPYTNDDPNKLLDENQANIDSVIGSGNYDIGHVFTTGGGGLAGLGVVGIDGRKAQGETGLDKPIGDGYWVDYVAHEMGHQFGGDHTFNNDSDGSCGGNRNASTAYEPGSGATIMAYAGICGAQDLQPHSDPFFHSASIDEIIDHVDSVIPNVGTRTNTNNSIPVPSAGSPHTIPARTPFVLTASATDANAGDQLTYDWQERDLGPANSVSDPDNGTSPLFRTWPPTVDASRTFPRLSDLVANQFAVGEKLPTTNRDLNFRVLVRDNRVGGGAIDGADTKIKVVDTGKPFQVTSPNTNVSWDGLSFQTVTWDVAGTDANGINASKVDITMSTDGGLTYPLTLAAGVPNNGSASVRIPNTPTTSARIRVQGSQNIFFDISNANFTVTAAINLIDISLAGNAMYSEDSLPTILSPAAVVVAPNTSTYDGGILTLSIIANGESEDKLGFVDPLLTSTDISVQGNQVFSSSTLIGTFVNNGSSLAVTFNTAATTTSVQSVIRALTFVSTSQSPSETARSLELYLDDGINGASNHLTELVTVFAVNDAPVMSDVSLPSIDEDTSAPTGTTIQSLIGPVFSDVDKGASFSGIVVSANPNVANQGQWQYSANGGFTWTRFDVVTNFTAVVLSKSALLRFVPAADYFGSPLPLQYRGIDETYTGEFTTSLSRVTTDLSFVDNFDPISTNDTSIKIVIKPVNDPPRALVPPQETSVKQDQFLAFVVTSNFFVDIDDPTYTVNILQSTGAPLPSWLVFDPKLNFLSGVPTNDDVGEYSLSIIATDPKNASTVLPLHLTVINVNDPPTSIELNGGKVSENAPGAFIGNFSSADPDATDTIHWTVNDTRFEVHGTGLFLAPNAQLDYEASPTINILVTATDDGTPPLSLTVQKTIQVVDVNEFTPLLLPVQFNLTENVPDTTIVGTIVATDADTANTVRYRMVGQPSDAFTVDEDTGIVRIIPGTVIDYEKSSFRQFFVEAYDDGVPSRAMTASVNVNVIDVNEFAPEVSNTVISVSENEPNDQVFGRVQATDGDIKQSLTYAVVSSDAPFIAVSPSTGELTVTQSNALNFEAKQTYELVVSVTDSGTPSKSANATVTVNVLDANDEPTGATVANNQLLEEVSGFNLGKITILDEDVNQEYSIMTTDNRFVIVNGELQLAPDKFMTSADLSSFFVPIEATELGVTNPKTYPLSIQIDRVPNQHPWQNPVNNLDVNRDTKVDPLDVLALINAINANLRSLELPRPYEKFSLPDYDVNGDGGLSPLDALVVINTLNGGTGGEGETRTAARAPATVLDPATYRQQQAWLAAFTQLELEQTFNRRRKS